MIQNWIYSKSWIFFKKEFVLLISIKAISEFQVKVLTKSHNVAISISCGLLRTSIHQKVQQKTIDPLDPHTYTEVVPTIAIDSESIEPLSVLHSKLKFEW